MGLILLIILILLLVGALPTWDYSRSRASLSNWCLSSSLNSSDRIGIQ
jgi:hypothetical protein